jgi:hypothetical protein
LQRSQTLPPLAGEILKAGQLVEDNFKLERALAEAKDANDMLRKEHTSRF